ncbi:MAG: hypothetical protein RLY58_2393 [Pseudomonadota bacterium]|jgi:hypothetical protein
MSFALFNLQNRQTGDRIVRSQCTSALFSYQIFSSNVGAKVTFYGSDLINPNLSDLRQWRAIVTIEVKNADDHELVHNDQHCYEHLMCVVDQGPVEQIVVRSGVAG